MLPARQIKNLNVGAGSNAPSSSRLQAISVQIDSLLRIISGNHKLIEANGRMKISTGSSQAGSEQMEQRNKENYPRHQALHSENTENTSTSNLKETAAPSDGPISWSWAIRIQGDSGDSASP